MAWLRIALVNHVKRGKALRDRLPLTDLVGYVSQASLKSHTSDESKDHSKRVEALAVVTEVNLCSPLCQAWGAAKRGWGKERNTPPPAFRLSLPG